MYGSNPGIEMRGQRSAAGGREHPHRPVSPMCVRRWVLGTGLEDDGASGDGRSEASELAPLSPPSSLCSSQGPMPPTLDRPRVVQDGTPSPEPSEVTAPPAEWVPVTGTGTTGERCVHFRDRPDPPPPFALPQRATPAIRWKGSSRTNVRAGRAAGGRPRTLPTPPARPACGRWRTARPPPASGCSRAWSSCGSCRPSPRPCGGRGRGFAPMALRTFFKAAKISAGASA